MNVLQKIQRYFFLFYVDHFSHIPHTDVWDSAFGYAKEVERILEKLARRARAHIVLVGQEGVGSLGIAKAVGKRMKNHPELSGHTLFFLNGKDLFSSGEQGIHQLHVLAKTLSEMERMGNSVVVFSGMSDVFAGKYNVQAHDILHPFYSSPSVKTITILTDEEYHAHIATNKDIARFVETIQINGLSSEHTKKFLKKKFGSSVPHEVLDEVVHTTTGIHSHVPYPKRAIDIVHKVVAENMNKKEHIVEHISRVIGFDLRRLQEAQQYDMKLAIRRFLINQEQAIDEISQAFVRARGKNADVAHPIASLFFTGPDGVGKKEAAKAIAQVYFGASTRMVTLNLAQNAEDLPSTIAQNPFTVLLVEGLEQTSLEHQEQFIHALREGYVSDTFARKHFVTNMIVIAVGNPENISEELISYFDGVAHFVSLSSEHVRGVARKMLSRLNGRLQIEYNVSLEVTPELIDYLVQHGYSEEAGAREMPGLLWATVERAAMQVISKGKILPGGKILIDPRQFLQSA